MPYARRAVPARLTADARSAQRLIAFLCTALFAQLIAVSVLIAEPVPVTITAVTDDAERNWKQSFSQDGRYVTYEDLLYNTATVRLLEIGSIGPEDIGSYVHGESSVAEYTDSFTWHPTEQWFAGSVAERGNYNLVLFRLDRSRRTVLSGASGWQGDARFFPDRNRLAFVTGEAGNGDIALCTIPRGRPELLTDDPAMDYAPDVSPAGMVLFTSRRTGSDNLYLIDPRTRELRQLTFSSDNLAYGTFVDETHIVAYRNTDLVELTLPARSIRTICDDVFLEQRPAIRPGGEWVAYIENRADAKPLMMVNRITREVRELETGMYYHERPVWYPDGSAILVQAFNGLQWDLYKVDVQ